MSYTYPNDTAPILPTLDAAPELAKKARRTGWLKFGLGLAWMTPVGYLLTNGQDLSKQWATSPLFGDHFKTVEISVMLACVASVLGMAIMFRLAFNGRASIALAVGMGVGFAVGCGPAEIMAQLTP